MVAEACYCDRCCPRKPHGTAMALACALMLDDVQVIAGPCVSVSWCLASMGLQAQQGRAIGVANAVHVRHRLAVLAQDLHLLIHWDEAPPVGLCPNRSQVQALRHVWQPISSHILAQDLHLLIHWDEAPPVGLHPNRSQVLTLCHGSKPISPHMRLDALTKAIPGMQYNYRVESLHKQLRPLHSHICNTWPCLPKKKIYPQLSGVKVFGNM